MRLTDEEKEVGQDNFNDAVGWSRRDFLTGVAAGGAGLGAAYFSYSKLDGSPVKVAWIGTGDEGSVLLNEHPPAYMDITAIADLRPTNRDRAFEGDGNDVRRGLTKILGKDHTKKLKDGGFVYSSHKDLLKAIEDKKVEVEAVVIAVPLSQHAPLAIECMNAGLHVLTEKLMARTIGQCKEMIATARKNNVLLAVGHQRHYNVLYENANDLVQRGMLGDIKHIRAQWHRNNSYPFRDSWRKDVRPVKTKDGWKGEMPKDFAMEQDMLKPALLKEFGYKDYNQLANWRIYNETGGGLMAELGSHQLDAASIFLGKVKPIAVTGFGGKNFYGVNWKDEQGDLQGVGPRDKWLDDREIADHVYTIFEFPGPDYANNNDDIVIVTYSSISTNTFEPYGEMVYGSRGTLVMEQEQKALLYKEGSLYEQRLQVSGEKEAVVETSASLSASPTAQAVADKMGDKVSRGYTEEMEHFCWAIRNLGPMYYRAGKPIPREENGLRCPDVNGMADAIMALTSNIAMEKKQRIEFKDEWFDPNDPATPEEDLKA